MATARVTAGTARTRGDLGFGMIVSVQQRPERNNSISSRQRRHGVDCLRRAASSARINLSVIVHIQLVVLFDN
jgi:hypothetical protein